MFKQGSVRELNGHCREAVVLPPYQGGVRPEHLQTNVFAKCSDPGWIRTITFLDVGQVSLPLDHGINLSVTEVGVEPTGTRLSTSSLGQFAYPAN